MQTTPGYQPPKKRPVGMYLLAAVLLVLLIMVVARSCRDDYGDVPPAYPDTLHTDTLYDTTAVPPPTDNSGAVDTADNADTGLEDPGVVAPGIAPQGPGGPNVTPAAPATPGIPGP